MQYMWGMWQDNSLYGLEDALAMAIQHEYVEEFPELHGQSTLV